jgi:hypothetical protein
LGKLVQLRAVVYIQDRWKFTFERARLTQRDRAALGQAINLLRWKELPLPLDRDASAFPPIFIRGTYSHYVPGTCFRVVYRFKEDVLILVSIHRIAV